MRRKMAGSGEKAFWRLTAEGMIAPRKKLWSTPLAAVDVAIDFLKPTPEDVVFDVGCGDGW